MKSKRAAATEKGNKHRIDKSLEQGSTPIDSTLPSKQDGLPEQMDEQMEELMPEPVFSSPVTSDRYLHLPPEILYNIASYIPYQERPQQTLHAATLVSRSWYSAAVSLLYRRPYITGKNFNLFVTTVCPSINLYVRKSELAKMVRVLDMGNLVHESRKTLTARLLGRLKGSLEEFRAPQSSFAFNSLAALSKCHSLRHLDLSLISEALSLSALFRSLIPLTNLTSLYFPRASIEDTPLHNSPPQWPPKLHELYISGGLRDTSLPYFTSLPPTLKSLTIDRCPFLPVSFVRELLGVVGKQLQYLKIGWHMPKLGEDSLNDILFLAPNVSELSIAVGFLGIRFVYPAGGRQQAPHPVECITFDSPPYKVPYGHLAYLGDFLSTMVSNGSLSNLRRVNITRRGLEGDVTECLQYALEELGELLEALERENHKAKGGKAGVWILED